MRIALGGQLVGVLVAPGEVLITEDQALVDVLEPIGHEGEVRVQRVINALNAAGYEVRGAYLSGEQAAAREKDLLLFHTGTKHQVGVRMTVAEDFALPQELEKKVEVVITDTVGVSQEPTPPPAEPKKGGRFSWLS